MIEYVDFLSLSKLIIYPILNVYLSDENFLFSRDVLIVLRFESF